MTRSLAHHSPATIYDPALKVTWLANADLAATRKFGVAGINKDGSMTYAAAQKWVRGLNRYHGKGYLGHHNWTLPVTPTRPADRTCSNYNGKYRNHFGFGCTTAPLASLYMKTLRVSWPDTAVPVPDEKTGPFFDFQPYLYWTSDIASDGGPKTFSFNTGWSGSNTNQHFMYVLPNIAGNQFNAKPKAGETLVPAAGGDAVFEPDAGPGDAGITWLADADLAQTDTFGLGVDKDGSMEETTAVRWIAGMNALPWLAKTGWSLPSKKELSALYAALKLSKNEPVVRVPKIDKHGFTNIQPYLYWSCNSETVHGPCIGVPNPNNQQWSFSFGNGFLGTDILQNQLYVMVYYRSPHRS